MSLQHSVQNHRIIPVIKWKQRSGTEVRTEQRWGWEGRDCGSMLALITTMGAFAIVIQTGCQRKSSGLIQRQERPSSLSLLQRDCLLEINFFPRFTTVFLHTTLPLPVSSTDSLLRRDNGGIPSCFTYLALICHFHAKEDLRAQQRGARSSGFLSSPQDIFKFFKNLPNFRLAVGTRLTFASAITVVVSSVCAQSFLD